jgi:hypothetical protein
VLFKSEAIQVERYSNCSSFIGYGNDCVMHSSHGASNFISDGQMKFSLNCLSSHNCEVYAVLQMRYV